jgi:GH43 family beta-xylosidase
MKTLSRRPRLIGLLFLLCLLCASIPAARAATTFHNPVFGAGADPSVVYSGGWYYLVQSDGDIHVTRSRTLTGLGSGVRVTVWRHAASGALCCNIWAPELLLINGKWYIYFAADDGANANHRMWVIESVGADPQGGYNAPTRLTPATDRWAIDATVLRQDNGALYLVWSGWPGTTNVQQNLYIAAMSSPTALSSDRVLISEPTNAWERIGGAPYINEGPELIKRNGVITLVYSASGSWTDDYCLGWLTNSDGNLLNRASWTKSSGCVFSKRDTAYGPGHNSFTTSPDGAESWMLYHANAVAGSGWNGRSIRAQKFSWNANNTPNFGSPVATYQWIAAPSGEAARTYEAENAALTRATVVTRGDASNGKKVGYIDYADSAVRFTVSVAAAGSYTVTIRYGNGSGATSSQNLSVNGGAARSISYPNTGWDNWSSAYADVTLNAGSNTLTFTKGANYAELDFIEVFAR